MTSFEPNGVSFGELLLTLYVDASFSTGGASCILSMKTNSAVALKQLNTQSVTVRSRTSAQKLTCLRELVYQVPLVEPVYISGQSQRADGQTQILSGQALRQAQQHFNLLHIQSCESRCVIMCN